MPACTHLFADPRRLCPHHAGEEGGRCVWHSPRVRKSDPYVTQVLLASLARSRDFAEAHLVGLPAAGIDLHAAVLVGADLRDGRFEGANLSGADLSEACLRRCGLRGATLARAKLAHADLSGCDLRDADLREADLSHAVIDATVLLGADLRGANLAGARITSFAWNRRTRFGGVRGLDAVGEANDDDSTQIAPAPLTLDADLDTPGRMADADPGADATRIWRAVPLVAAGMSADILVSANPAPASTPSVPTPPVRRSRWAWVVPGLIGASLVGACWGGVAAVRGSTDHGGVVADGVDLKAKLLAQANAQHEADVAEMTRLQSAVQTAEETANRVRQQLSAAEAMTERQRTRLQEQDLDLAKLEQSDLRAELAALRIAELEKLARDLAAASARQDAVSRILAEGVDRYQSESKRLGGVDEMLKERTRIAERAQAESLGLRRDLLAVTQERDAVQTLYQQSRSELGQARLDIDRILTRIGSSSLQDLLADDGGPMLAIHSGTALTLGGEYLVTLQVDRGAAATGMTPAQVGVRLVIQRPAGARIAPDATVILYDRDQRPLRRLSFGFPHQDGATPFATVAATVACDRFPTYARVQLLPGADGRVAAK